MATVRNELLKLFGVGTRRKRRCSRLTKNLNCRRAQHRAAVRPTLKQKPPRQGRTNGLVTAARGDCRRDHSSLHHRNGHLHLLLPPLLVHAKPAIWLSTPSLH